MPEYILLTDPDGTNRVVPKSNLPFIQKRNDANKEHERLKIGQTFPNEEMANAFVIANPVVIGHTPIKAIDTLQVALKESNSEIAALKAKLAEMENKAQNTPANEPETIGVRELLEKIKTASKPELEAMLVGETRKTVIETINKKLSNL